MAWIPQGEKNSKISLFVLAQLTNVTDGRTDVHWMTAKTALMHRSRGKKAHSKCIFDQNPYENVSVFEKTARIQRFQILTYHICNRHCQLFCYKSWIKPATSLCSIHFWLCGITAIITFDKCSIHNVHKFSICHYIGLFKQKMLYSTNRHIFTDLPV